MFLEFVECVIHSGCNLFSGVWKLDTGDHIQATFKYIGLVAHIAQRKATYTTFIHKSNKHNKH
jgi:hypothetical protein